MLGVVLLSESNEIVFALGNDPFRSHFSSASLPKCSVVDDPGPSSSSAAAIPRPTSSSSGVSSTSADSSSLWSVKGKTKDEEEGEEFNELEDQQEEEDLRHRLDETFLLHQLLPLVMMCRAKQQQTHEMTTLDELQRIDAAKPGATSSPFSIRMVNLPHSNLLVLIHEESALCPPSFSSDHLFSALRLCVLYHFGGPSLRLIPLRSAFMRLVNQRCERRMMRILNDAIGTKSEENREKEEKERHGDCCEGEEHTPLCQNLSFGTPSRLVQRTLMPLFKDLSQRIADRIGRRCRCLFLHSGRLVATASSHGGGEPTLAALHHGDLRSLLQFARQRPSPVAGDCDRGKGRSLKCHAELGVWLFSKSLRRRQLHNVLVLSLSDRVEVICLALAEGAQLIGAIWEALELLDKIGEDYCDSGRELLNRCDRQLAKGLKMMANRENKFRRVQGAEWQQFTFLENIPRSQKLIQHHWNRLRSAINTFSAQSCVSSGVGASPLSSPPPPLLHPFHCSSTSSSLSPFRRLSLLPSTFSSPHHQQSTISSAASSSSSHPSPLPPPTPSSAISSSVCSTFRLSSVHLDAMRVQLEKVLRALLDELLLCSASLSLHHSLPSVQLALRLSMGPQLAVSLGQLDAETAKIGHKIHCGDSPLRPVLLGFDMIAFHFCRFGGSAVPLFLHYAPEDFPWQMLIGTQLMMTESEESERNWGEYGHEEEEANGGEEEITFARTAEGELLIQIQNRNSSTPVASRGGRGGGSAPSGLLAAVAMPISRRLSKLSPASSSSTTVTPAALCRCSVLFSRHTNTALAVRQTSALMAMLNVEMESNIVPNFQ